MAEPAKLNKEYYFRYNVLAEVIDELVNDLAHTAGDRPELIFDARMQINTQYNTLISVLQKRDILGPNRLPKDLDIENQQIQDIITKIVEACIEVHIQVGLDANVELYDTMYEKTYNMLKSAINEPEKTHINLQKKRKRLIMIDEEKNMTKVITPRPPPEERARLRDMEKRLEHEAERKRALEDRLKQEGKLEKSLRFVEVIDTFEPDDIDGEPINIELPNIPSVPITPKNIFASPRVFFKPVQRHSLSEQKTPEPVAQQVAQIGDNKPMAFDLKSVMEQVAKDRAERAAKAEKEKKGLGEDMKFAGIGCGLISGRIKFKSYPKLLIMSIMIVLFVISFAYISYKIYLNLVQEHENCEMKRKEGFPPALLFST